MSQPFGFGMGSGDPNRPFDMSSLGAALQQFGAMLQQPQGADEGPVRWSMVRDLARQAIAAEGDPVVADAQARAVADAARLADLWLDEATTLPASAGSPAAWSRSEWLEGTLPSWRRYIAPIAEAVNQLGGDADLATLSAEDLMAQLPEEMRAMLPPEGIPPQLLQMLGPMLGMMRQMGAVAFSSQLGQSLAALAKEVAGSAEVGVPLTDDGRVTLLPRNIEAIADELELPRQDLLVYSALREAAHQRLFSHVPWLRARLLGAIEEYARGVQVDPARMESMLGTGIDLSSPEALQQLLASGVMQPEDTPEQQAARARLEALLACVEGWVDDVVTVAVADRLPTAPAMREAMRRRRAAGGPAQKAFETLIGMTLRPRLMREAGTVFGALRATGSVEERDRRWDHPDLLPTSEDLEDALGFVERVRGGGEIPDDLSGLEQS